MEPVWRNARTCLKPGILFFFVFFVSVLFTSFLQPFHPHWLQRPWQWRTGSSLLPRCSSAFAFVTWVSVKVRMWVWLGFFLFPPTLFFFFFSFCFFVPTWNRDCADNVAESDVRTKYFGAGQLDVAAKAVSATGHIVIFKGNAPKKTNKSLNVVFLQCTVVYNS